MSFDGSKIARSIYEGLDHRDFESATEHVSDGALLLDVATGDVYRGKPGYLEFIRGWATAFPDLRCKILEVGAAGEQAFVEYELEGTHTGPLLTPGGHIPATGMEVQLQVCDILQLDGEKITSIRSYFDTTTLLRQLGLVTRTPLHPPDRRAPLELYAQALDTNAPERHKAIVHRFIESVYNRQDPAAAADTCGRDYLWHGGQLGEAHGIASYQKVLTSFFIAFPDFGVEIHDTIAEKDRVVVRFSMQGTHLGHFHGVAPSFRQVSGGGTSTYRITENRIVEEWWQGDLLLLLRQPSTAPSTVHRPS